MIATILSFLGNYIVTPFIGLVFVGLIFVAISFLIAIIATVYKYSRNILLNVWYAYSDVGYIQELLAGGLKENIIALFGYLLIFIVFLGLAFLVYMLLRWMGLEAIKLFMMTIS